MKESPRYLLGDVDPVAKTILLEALQHQLLLVRAPVILQEWEMPKYHVRRRRERIGSER